MTAKLTNLDPAKHLQSDESIADFVAAAFETNDPAYVTHALGVVVRAKGMTQIANETGLSREQLYRSLSNEGNPTLRTVFTVLKALRVELTVKPATVH